LREATLVSVPSRGFGSTATHGFVWMARVAARQQLVPMPGCPDVRSRRQPGQDIRTSGHPANSKSHALESLLSAEATLSLARMPSATERSAGVSFTARLEPGGGPPPPPTHTHTHTQPVEVSFASPILIRGACEQRHLEGGRGTCWFSNLANFLATIMALSTRLLFLLGLVAGAAGDCQTTTRGCYQVSGMDKVNYDAKITHEKCAQMCVQKQPTNILGGEPPLPAVAGCVSLFFKTLCEKVESSLQAGQESRESTATARQTTRRVSRCLRPAAKLPCARPPALCFQAASKNLSLHDVLLLNVSVY
jgi:hypothetical protein